MKIINGNISPLPFYDSIKMQNHRKSYAFGNVYPLVTYMSMLLPFQVVLSNGTNISRVLLYNFNDNTSIDITNSMIENGLLLKKYNDFCILKYHANLPIPEIKYEGRFYLVITVADLGDIYSDVFTITNNIDKYVQIEYYNTYNFELYNCIIDFSDNFKFKTYIDTVIGKPEYTFEEEVTERMGYSFVENQISKKIYKFTFIAPEYLCDALRIIRLCDNKKIITSEKTFNLLSFSMEPEWEEQGDLASVECEFETDTVIANITGYASVPLGGDYNNKEYNNDYLIQ